MNIFEDIRNMTDEEIKMQIAMLNCINLANAAKETTDTVWRATMLQVPISQALKRL
ncbi:MAG: hypothetical protein ACLSW1_03335 [Lachnospira sp.]